MRPDSRTVAWLQRALQHELSAVQQYLAQSVLARLLGDAALGDQLRQEALEELGHAEELMQRLIQLGIAPHAGALEVAHLGQGPQDFAALNRQMEWSAVRLYQDATDHARRVRDGATEALMQRLAREEAGHLERLGS